MPLDRRDQLTPSQWRVAELVAEGLSNKAIGERLSLSHKTIQRHLYDIFRRLNMSSRAELAAGVARRLGSGRAKGRIPPDSSPQVGPLHPEESSGNSQTQLHKTERIVR